MKGWKVDYLMLLIEYMRKMASKRVTINGSQREKNAGGEKADRVQAFRSFLVIHRTENALNLRNKKGWGGLRPR